MGNGGGTPAPFFDLQRFAGERTLPATPRRRQKARERGQVGRSAELAGAAGLMAAAVVVRLVAQRSGASYAGYAAGLWGHLPAAGLSGADAGALLRSAAGAGLTLGLPVMGAALLVTLLAGVAQTGLLFTPAALAPDLSRINPLQGVQRLVSRRALVELAKSLLKLVAVSALSAGPVLALVHEVARGDVALPAVASLTLGTAQTLMLRAAGVLLLSGVADFFYQRLENETSLRMTTEDVRQEVRETDGDPQLRAGRRRRARELARRRMLSDVARADVVLTNPTHYAVALRYDAEQMAAPVVVAKGRDFLAERIRAIASGAGVPIVENPPLARSLYGGVKVGAPIPAALYQAVAEVLAFVWRVRGRL